MEKKDLLIISPYTYITLIGQNYLLYNTVNGESLEGTNSEIVKIISKLLRSNSQWLYYISNSDTNAEIHKFILEIREKNIGDYIKDYAGQNPIQLYPIKNIQHDVQRYNGKTAYRTGDNVTTYLHELSIYVNNQCSQKCHSCNWIYKQYPFCHKEKACKSLDLKELSTFLRKTAFPSLYRVNVIGGDIQMYNQLEELQQVLSMLNAKIYYYTHISNIGLMNLNTDTHIVVLVNVSDYKETYEKEFHATDNIEYNFFVTNEAELNFAYNLINKHQLKHYQIRPLYIKESYRFFKENVFINKEDIVGHRHSFQDIFRNDTLNSNYFGKLTILADGKVFADINKKAIGDIYHNSISELIWEELEHGKSWLRIRKQQKPCNKCVLQAFCPSTSNIEIALKKNNLCYKSIE